MSPGALLATAALLFLIASVPIWPWSRQMSYRPAIALAVVFTFTILLWVFTVA